MIQAKEADATLAKLGASTLVGIPIAHKDVFVTKNWKTTAGSKILTNYMSPFDAHVVAKLGTQGAGMVCLGKLNMDEFAMGSSNENSSAGPVKILGIYHVYRAAHLEVLRLRLLRD